MKRLFGSPSSLSDIFQLLHSLMCCYFLIHFLNILINTAEGIQLEDAVPAGSVHSDHLTSEPFRTKYTFIEHEFKKQTENK